MQVRPYKARDIHSINRWMHKRGLKMVSEKDLPQIGFTVPGVAIGFIRRCEGGIGIFESLVSNPWASSQSRNAAMEAIFQAVMSHPDFERIVGFSLDAGALSRGVRKGWSSLPYQIMSWSK